MPVTIRETEVRQMMGSIARDKVLNILRALLDRDASATLMALADLSELTPDFENVLAELLSLFHHMALAKKVPEALDDFVSERDALVELSEQVSSEDLQLFYQIALIGRRDLPLAPDMRSGLEMVLLRMLSFRPAQASASMNKTSASLNQTNLNQTNVNQTNINQTTASAATQKAVTNATARTKPAAQPASVKQANAKQANAKQTSAEQAATVAASAEPTQKSFSSPTQAGQQDWRTMLDELAISGMVKQLAANCILRDISDDTMVLLLDYGHRQLLNVKAEKRLQQALCEYFDRDLRVEIIIDSKSNAAEAKIETPAQSLAREKDERQEQAEESIEEDGFVKAMKEYFNAEIVPGSVKPTSDEIS